MIAVVQRVSSAHVEAPAENHTAAIGRGLAILLGVEEGDSEQEIAWGAKKCAQLRIFNDQTGKLNLSIKDLQGEALVISQFTLAGDCRKGNRPSFVRAATPDIARPLYERFCELLEKEHAVPVKKGVFQAQMTVRIVNEGPVTLIVEKSLNREGQVFA